MKKIKSLGKAAVFLTLCVALLAGCSKTEPPASAQGEQTTAPSDKYPDRPITLYVVQAQGGATDMAAQTWRAFVEKELGVPLDFQYKPGANGEIGLTVLANAKTDGYELAVCDSMTAAISLMIQKPKYTLDSFEYLVSYFEDPGILMAHKDEPYNNLTELIAYAKTRPPESLSIGVPAMSDPNVFGIRQLEEATGVKFNIVNFNGGGKARTALAGHQIEMGAFMYYGSRTVAEETKILGRTVNTTKVPAIMDKQSHSEVAGKQLDDVFSYNQIMAPAGFKAQYPERYQFIIDAFKRALNSPEFQEHLKNLDQVEWLNQIYGDDNIAYNASRIEFGRKIAPLIMTAE